MESMSIYNCIFCNALLDGNAKILKCLHVICTKCVELKCISNGLRCKCNTITKGEITNYPIISPSLSTIKLCDDNDCNDLASKICIICNSFYCKSCSKVHINTDHKQPLMMPYPKDKYNVLCSTCKRRCIEVCCTKCGVIICSLCHLQFHHSHEFKVLANFSEEIITDISMKKVDLKKYHEFINKHLAVTNIQTMKLRSQKKKIKKEIDEQFELLHMDISKRKKELTKLVNKCFKDANLKIDENKNILQELKEKNKYMIDLSRSIINHDNIIDIIKLSKMTINKINSTRKFTLNLNSLISGEPIYLQFLYDESLKNCRSSIKEVGSIIPPKVQNLVKIINPQSLSHSSHYLVNSNNNAMNSILNDQEISLFDEDNSNVFLLPICVCCNSWSEEMNQCSFCKRFYHNDCHIPLLETTVYGTLLTSFKCTMCDEIIFEFDSDQINIIEDLSINKIEWKLIERLLMELYCQNSYIDFFRNCPNKSIYPDYYLLISNPISLNDIKNRHESAIPYESIIDFIMDVKRIFSNAKLYFHENDPYYKSAVKLEGFFNLKLISWIPELKNCLVIDVNIL